MLENLLTSAPFDPWAEPKFWLDVIDKGIKATALAVGAAWTVLNYRRGRTFAKRLEFEHAARLFHRAGQPYVILRCRMKNLGLSKVNIQQAGTGCELFELTAADWNPPSTLDPNYVFSIYSEHEWIEAQEELFHEELVPLKLFSPETAALRLRLTVKSSGWFGKKALVWETSSIIELAKRSNQ